MTTPDRTVCACIRWFLDRIESEAASMVCWLVLACAADHGNLASSLRAGLEVHRDCKVLGRVELLPVPSVPKGKYVPKNLRKTCLHD